MVMFLGAIALIVWPISGATTALLIAGAALLLVIHGQRLELKRFLVWLRDPRLETIPDGDGAWEDVYSQLARSFNTQRQQANALSAALQRFQQAGAAVPDGLVILDAHDAIQWCNPAAEAHFGVDLRRDAGHQITYLVRSPSFVLYLRAESHPEPLILRLNRNLERPEVLSVQLVPFGDRDRLLISHDVARIEAVERVRRDFVANVSHELRTPLTVIIGFTETVLDNEELPPSMRRPLSMVMDQAGRMQRLVDDLLVLSRLESDDNPLPDETVDAPSLVHRIHEDALALSNNRHRVVLAVCSSACVRGSGDELRSAFQNLVTNAIRYTPEGGEIYISWLDDGQKATFEVRDTGIGIAAQHLARLTERFYRVDRSRSRETGGTGLGLAIVKHVATRHGARLDIASQVGEGSRFSIVFPVARVTRQAAQDEQSDS